MSKPYVVDLYAAGTLLKTWKFETFPEALAEFRRVEEEEVGRFRHAMIYNEDGYDYCSELGVNDGLTETEREELI